MVPPLTCMSGSRKRVNMVRIKVTKTMIDEAVGGFVGANGIQVVVYRCVFEKAPVIFGDKGWYHLSPVPTNLLAQTGCGTHNLHVPLGGTPLQVLGLLNCMCTSPWPLP